MFQIDNMLDFINGSPSPYHAVNQSAVIFEKEGFQRLQWQDKWELLSGHKYFISNGGAIFAFIIPNDTSGCVKYKMVGSHSDSPTLKIKPSGVFNHHDLIVKINTEVYGGPILYSWFDRPLSIAGRVSFIDGSGDIITTTVDFERPIAILPSVAIHLNREVNQKGIAISNQKDILPIVALSSGDKFETDYLEKIISSKLSINKDKLLDYELNFYSVESGRTIGFDNELVSSARLDNLSMFYISIESLISQSAADNTIKILAGYNHEEIGSGTTQGASSTYTIQLIERIYAGMGKSREEFLNANVLSTVVSADLSHANHPNAPDKSDPVLKNEMNKGIAIKYNYTQNYVTDSPVLARAVAVCKSEDIMYQKHVNNSDLRGGSTIGPHIASLLGCQCIDVGVPVLSMHSICETGGSEDFKSMYRFMNAFYEKM